MASATPLSSLLSCRNPKHRRRCALPAHSKLRPNETTTVLALELSCLVVRRAWESPLQKLFLLILTCCLSAFCLTSVVKAAAGDLDPTYLNGGGVTTNFFVSDVLW